MKLFLASDIKNPACFEKLTEFVGGFENKSIAYICTAANGEGWGSWKVGGSWTLAQSLPANVTLIQLEDFHNTDVLPQLKDKDIIWLAGGITGYLMYWLRRTHVDQALRNFLESGTSLVGSSAGSMITAPTLDVSRWYIGEEDSGAEGVAGLNLVDFDIYPHYRDEQLTEIKEKFQGEKMYLLKDGEALLVEDGVVTVFGTEKIITNSLAKTLFELENLLLQPDVRKSAHKLNELLAGDFHEFGSSGRIFTKAEIIQDLSVEEETQYSITDFKITQLSLDTVLCTYKISSCQNGQTSYSLRSSLWKNLNGRWQMIFHPGSKIPNN